MKKSIFIALAFMFIFSTIYSQQNKMHRGFVKEDRKLVKLLKLTDEQTKKFSDLKYADEQKSIDLRSQIEKNRLELRKLMSEKTLDSKKILELTNKNSEIQSKLKEMKVKTMLELNNILTEEQKQVFAEHRKQMKENMQDNCCEMPMRKMPGNKRF